MYMLTQKLYHFSPFHKKQANRTGEGILLGYSNENDKQYWCYFEDLGYCQRSGSIEFDESIIGGSLQMKLRNLLSSVIRQGTCPNLVKSKTRGRTTDAGTITSPTSLPVSMIIDDDTNISIG